MLWPAALVAMFALAARAREIDNVTCSVVYGSNVARISKDYWLAQEGSLVSFMTFENDDPVYFFMGRALGTGASGGKYLYRVTRDNNTNVSHVQTSLFIPEHFNGGILLDMGSNYTHDAETDPEFLNARYLVVNDTEDSVREETLGPCPEMLRTLDVSGRTTLLYPSRYLHARDRMQVEKTMDTAKCVSTSVNLDATVVFSVDFPFSERAILRVTQTFYPDDRPQKHLLYLASQGGKTVHYSEVSATVTPLPGGNASFNVTIEFTDQPDDTTIHLWVSPKGINDDPDAVSAYYILNSLSSYDDPYAHEEISCDSVYQNIVMVLGSVVNITSPDPLPRAPDYSYPTDDPAGETTESAVTWLEATAQTADEATTPLAAHATDGYEPTTAAATLSTTEDLTQETSTPTVTTVIDPTSGAVTTESRTTEGTAANVATTEAAGTEGQNQEATTAGGPTNAATTLGHQTIEAATVEDSTTTARAAEYPTPTTTTVEPRPAGGTTIEDPTDSPAIEDTTTPTTTAAKVTALKTAAAEGPTPCVTTYTGSDTEAAQSATSISDAVTPEDLTPETTTPVDWSVTSTYISVADGTSMPAPTPSAVAHEASTTPAPTATAVPTSHTPKPQESTSTPSRAPTTGVAPVTANSLSPAATSSERIVILNTATASSGPGASTGATTAPISPPWSASPAGDGVTTSAARTLEPSSTRKAVAAESTTAADDVATSELGSGDYGDHATEPPRIVITNPPGITTLHDADAAEEDPWPTRPLYSVNIVNATLTANGMLTATCMAAAKAKHAITFTWHVGSNMVPAITGPPEPGLMFNGNRAWSSRLQTVEYGISPSARLACMACTVPPAQRYCAHDVAVVARHDRLELDMQVDVATVSVVCSGLDGVESEPYFVWTANGRPVPLGSVRTKRIPNDYGTPARWQSAIHISRFFVPAGHRDVYECTATLASGETIKATKNWSNTDYLALQKNAAARSTFVVAGGITAFAVAELL
ncbi:gp60 [Psittacid alphaherpesvirus 1]|uniref:Uncharacterized protein sORF2 n=1 Tax=Psittacid herpesvirus 1 (isolate Amazon parrot/-/97-0001/1997) TaxID=670426 RepID=ORF2_PSHV1|nr:envelope glycoprotein J [Psittacid alphaherpesvirus 1]Q6UDF7.1 RecName: Full=Uncharacterized protein sORF2; Flags: Precursor [Psittacid herpesvirus 1 Amazon parrot/1997]AAQ73753.1 gp60 [Psittacid alphaherpesvirus 1]